MSTHTEAEVHRSDEYSQLPVILQTIFPPLLINIEQTEDIIRGMCPTTCIFPLISFIIATTCGLCPLPASHTQETSSPTNGLGQIGW